MNGPAKNELPGLPLKLLQTNNRLNFLLPLDNYLTTSLIVYGERIEHANQLKPTVDDLIYDP
ncbi:MAG: hypothetical protein JW884_04160 [Deltaproteobacteria bacterium]|nr:hypothetical protein [Deltaproteobacteria bacterium]